MRLMSNPLSQLDSIEADLISRVCHGEHKAFEELVRPYERLVYVTAISVLRNSADAEEVAQEAVLKAFSKLSSFRAECKFSTWLVQITYNEARMKLRKDRRHLYESVDDPQQGMKATIGPKILRIGGSYPPNYSKTTRFARRYRMQSIRSMICTARS